MRELQGVDGCVVEPGDRVGTTVLHPHVAALDFDAVVLAVHGDLLSALACVFAATNNSGFSTVGKAPSSGSEGLTGESRKGDFCIVETLGLLAAFFSSRTIGIGSAMGE